MNYRNIFLTLLGLGADVISVTSGTAGASGSTAAELIVMVNVKFGYMLEP